jgi:hypothetical protein
MSQFKSREEYEQWKVERMKGLVGNFQPKAEEQKPHRPQAPSADRRPPSSGSGLRSLGELFGDTWNLFKARFLTLICLYLLSVVFMIVGGGVFAGAGYFLGSLLAGGSKAFIAVGIFMGIVAGSTAMFWGISAFTFAVVDETLGVRDALSNGWRRIWSYTWVSFLFAFIVGGGFLLFFIPGLIFLVWFLFSQFVVVAEDEKGMAAILRSKEYVRGHWFAVFIRVFVIWLVSAGLGFIPVVGPILSIPLVPFMMIFIKLIYDDLKESKGEIVTHSPSFGARAKWIGAGALGYVAVPVVLFVMTGATLTVPLLMLKGMMDNPGGQFTITKKSGGPSFRMKPGPQRPQESIQAVGTMESGPQVPSRTSPLQQEAKKPEPTGEARIIRDGVKETFALQTGFFSDTRLANPKRATVQYQIPAEKHSNARRIEMVLDVTKVGGHSVDGNYMRDTFMGKSREELEQENKPRFQYVADGGQIFFPKDGCTIVVTSPYTGTPDGVFGGEVKDCVVTSAGITHTVSAEFKMVGTSSR